MVKFRDAKALKKLASLHASIDSLFSRDRQVNPGETFKQYRSATLG